jgi:hypothetical protein
VSQAGSHSSPVASSWAGVHIDNGRSKRVRNVSAEPMILIEFHNGRTLRWHGPDGLLESVASSRTAQWRRKRPCRSSPPFFGRDGRRPELHGSSPSLQFGTADGNETLSNNCPAFDVSMWWQIFTATLQANRRISTVLPLAHDLIAKACASSTESDIFLRACMRVR